MQMNKAREIANELRYADGADIPDSDLYEAHNVLQEAEESGLYDEQSVYNLRIAVLNEISVREYRTQQREASIYN